LNAPTSLKTNFKQYLEMTKVKGAPVPAGLQELLLAVADTCNTLSHEVAQGALIGLLGSAGTGNVQGEVQQKLDVIANDLLIEGVQDCKSLAGLASEEMELPLPVQGTGDYLLLFDPLDGSSNIDVNVSIGTIFSVLKKQEPTTWVKKLGHWSISRRELLWDLSCRRNTPNPIANTSLSSPKVNK